MNEQDEPESSSNGVVRVSGVSGVSDTKADEEELYRLKIVALQECYNSVQLQTFRLRERIYNVRKQCRRLEGMKRAALNLLRYHTGTYDIPPLEIVDEDPVPSFLESLQKQQLVTPEAPRKKSKRPSRSKSDGKLTPEEEERAKQKICSIIDSVYSETARRMGDMPKSSIRCLNRDTSINSDDIPRKGRNSVHVDFENFDVRRLKVDEGNNDLEEFDGEDNHLDVPAMQLSADSQMTNMVDEEQGVKAVTSFNNTEFNRSHDSVFDQNRNANHPVVYDDEEKSSQQISYHDMETSLYNGVLEYGGSVQQVQGVSFGADLVNNPFNTSLDSVQPLDYDTPTSMVESNIYFANDSQLLVSCGSVHEVVENAAVYTNAVNCQNSSVSVKTNYNEDTNPLNLFDYAAVLNALQAMNDTTSTGPESNYPRNPDTPLSYRVEDVVTTQPEIASVNEAVSSELGRVKCESVEQPKIETPLPIAKQPEGVHVRGEKQEMQKSTNNDKVSNHPLPNFIPYRMITVENPKPVEIIMVDPSGGEVPPSKQLPARRRRKYKYVVESVLDNVPYTFRQAESDDDESNEKNSSTTTKTTLNLN